MKTAHHRFSSEVAFADTDASGRAHFSKILTFVEQAEHDLFAQLELPVFDPPNSGWPRARISCDYRTPLKFHDRFEVALKLEKIGTSSITWQFEISNPAGDLIAEGEMVSVKVGSEGHPLALTHPERSKFQSLKLS